VWFDFADASTLSTLPSTAPGEVFDRSPSLILAVDFIAAEIIL